MIPASPPSISAVLTDSLEHLELLVYAIILPPTQSKTGLVPYNIIFVFHSHDHYIYMVAHL